MNYIFGLLSFVLDVAFNEFMMCSLKQRLSITCRVVANHIALVPDVICQCGGHPSTSKDLGSVVLSGLGGALPDHTGHAQN